VVGLKYVPVHRRSLPAPAAKGREQARYCKGRCPGCFLPRPRVRALNEGPTTLKSFARQFDCRIIPATPRTCSSSKFKQLLALWVVFVVPPPRAARVHAGLQQRTAGPVGYLRAPAKPAAAARRAALVHVTCQPPIDATQAGAQLITPPPRQHNLCPPTAPARHRPRARAPSGPKCRLRGCRSGMRRVRGQRRSRCNTTGARGNNAPRSGPGAGHRPPCIPLPRPRQKRAAPLRLPSRRYQSLALAIVRSRARDVAPACSRVLADELRRSGGQGRAAVDVQRLACVEGGVLETGQARGAGQ
jgi:hypothetical protein